MTVEKPRSYWKKPGNKVKRRRGVSASAGKDRTERSWRPDGPVIRGKFSTEKMLDARNSVGGRTIETGQSGVQTERSDLYGDGLDRRGSIDNVSVWRKKRRDRTVRSEDRTVRSSGEATEHKEEVSVGTQIL
ncbi:hypothetical protein PR202_gb23767 [Eleusine coracana subsp. coracana]|uniref:Uncharacterized protein n=1 Tax=Eleusine coracana subsp. coracana TaxID=191504 RepID=A0AAV5FKW6_ELECO|nr:hypothetical protein PR202_gb23767 [Eleusine coracana subsp. coracana]